mgnify:CR=1 FL=1
MNTKVFLFEKDHWLYCNDVTEKDGVYNGWVVNGHWEMWATIKSIKSKQHTHETQLIWACDPDPNYAHLDYNEVIANAKARYESGEQANFDLKKDT